MSFMRGQANRNFNTNVPQRGFKMAGSSFRQSDSSGSYWASVGGASGSESYGEGDYGYGYEQDYSGEGLGGGEYDEGYGNEWQGGGQWQGAFGGGKGRGAGRGRGAGSSRGAGDWSGGGRGGRGGAFGYGSDDGVQITGGVPGSILNPPYVRGGGGRGRGGRGAASSADPSGSGGVSDAPKWEGKKEWPKPEKPNRPVVHEDINPNSPLNVLLEKWQTFAKEFPDCGNAISNLECSLKASKISPIQLNYECKFLIKCNNYNIFTGTLHINRVVSNKIKETIFISRGQGLNKKSAKLDCYEKAYKLLINSPVETIMSQEDFSEKVIKNEIMQQFRANPDSILEFVRGDNADENVLKSGKKRGGSQSGGSESKKSKSDPDYLENKNLSLAPTRKQDIIMRPEDTLLDKLYTLKQLLKDEGITRLHIVPKIDQLAHKAAIHIQNVYRFEDIPAYGRDSRVPVYCEIYFDDVYMTRGDSDFNMINAMKLAYNQLAALLYSEALEDIADNPRVWDPFMALDPDLCSVVTKWQGKDNDSLLTSNLANMKQMMQSMPDLTIPIEKLVLTEHETDQNIENVFKSLELSATRNLMLLECEIMRNADLTFTCTLSMQGHILVSRKSPTKNAAKRLCSEAVMKELKRNNDTIYVTSELNGRVVTKSDLLLAAAKKKALGEPPAKIFRKAEHKDDPSAMSPEERRKYELEKIRMEERENLPENISARPLIPWIASAMYDILDEFYEKITLEDLMIDVSEMPKSQRDIVSACATKMGMRMVTKTKTAFDGPILRRTVTAQDMCKILQLHGGQSGRYRLVSCVNRLSPEELEEFRNQCVEQHRLLVEARINDNPDEEPEVAEEQTEDQAAIADYYPESTSNTSSRLMQSAYKNPTSMEEYSYLSRYTMYPGVKYPNMPVRPTLPATSRPLFDPFYMRGRSYRY